MKAAPDKLAALRKRLRGMRRAIIVFYDANSPRGRDEIQGIRNHGFWFFMGFGVGAWTKGEE